MDQGLRGIIQIYEKNKRFPPRWALVARDAFNGVKLWERPMEDWSPGAWGNYGFRSNPLVLPRRLVASDDKVFVTLSYRGPLAMLDAATGKTLRVCEETANTHEIILIDGVLVLRTRGKTDDKSNQEWLDVPESVMAVDAHSGKTLWKKKCDGNLVPLTLATANGRVCYHNYSHVICLDLKNGKELWRAPCRERTAPRGPGDGTGREQPFRKGNTGFLVIYREVVLFAGADGLEAFSLETGEKLWTGPKVRSVAPDNCFVSTGLFCAQDAVWPMREVGSLNTMGSHANFRGYDPMTGKLKETVRVSHLLSRYHHVRCYPAKATERYLLLPKRGVEFLDLAGDDHMRHDWIKGVCAYGVMPANGMLYVPPHQCFCYPAVMLKGFNALTGRVRLTPGKDENRLFRGPAYPVSLSRKAAEPGDWPMYRHDRLRSGRADGKVPTKVKEHWKRKLGGKLTQPIVSGNRFYAVRKDEHTVHCLDTEEGESVWTYTADGRIDSSPTVYRGLLLFGCRDGWVYCLDASKGNLVWKFRGAPVERQITAFEQLESAWPVHGSVLVQNDIVYCTAGRSTFLDGGIHVYGLKPATGEVVHRTVVKSDRPDITKDPGRPFDMDGSLSDILVSDGTDLYMYQVRLTPELKTPEVPRISKHGARKVRLHLTSTKGFLDDTWYDRTYWSYSRMWPGFYFSYNGPKSGQILVFDEKTTYALKVFQKRPGRDGLPIGCR
jgi:outer membrane protein assembly factor BamB